MKCKYCEKNLPKDAKVCPYCGKPVGKPQEAKCWTTFGKVGYNLSLAGLILFWFPFVGLCLSVPGLVFASLSKKSKDNVEYHEKAFKMGLAGTILGAIIITIGILCAIIIPAVIGARS